MTKTLIFGLAALGLTAACGGGTPLTGGGSVVGNIAPSYADDAADTVANSLIDDGATGFVSVVKPMSAQGALQAMKVTLSPDRSSATVRVGNSTYNLDFGVGYSTTGGTYASTTNTSAPVVGLMNSDDTAIVSYTDPDGEMGFGIIGIETPAAGLPTGSVTYNGDYSVHIWPKSLAGSPDVALGDLTMDIDFAGGGVTGTLEESLTPIGTITGTVTDSRLSGDFEITGATHTGTVPFEGALYGDQAETAAGAFLGTVTDGTDDFYASGTFDATR